MVFTSLARYAYCPGPHRFWRRRKVFRLTAHYSGRSRNCWRSAMRRLQRAFVYSEVSREIKKKDMATLNEARIDAACAEHGISFRVFREALNRSEIFLNKKVLAELAIWEPRTFKSLTKLALDKAKLDGLAGINEFETPPGVFTRNMLRDNLPQLEPPFAPYYQRVSRKPRS